MMHGWLNLYKPPHMSSAKAVHIVRKVLNLKKVGHAGTLDPLAEGVLPLAINEATKTVAFVMSDEKEYEFEITWGYSTTTDDSEGEALESNSLRPTHEQITKVLKEFIGDQQQTPPSYSALKINGQRAYKLARSGQNVVLSQRLIKIHQLELIEIIDQNRARFKVSCGKGTYVRSLARDIAEKLHTKGHISKLIRTRVGKFYHESAFFLENIQELGHKVHTKDYIRPIADVLDDIPAISLTPDQVDHIKKGRAVEYPSFKTQGLDEHVLCLTPDHQALAIGIIEDGWVKPKRVLNI